MSRLVVVSLVGLGFAFYELSGGADFEPNKRAVALAPVAEFAPASSNPDNEPKQTQQARHSMGNTAPETRPAEVTAQLQTATLVPDGKTRLTLATQGLQLASLEEGLAAGTVAVSNVTPDVVKSYPAEIALDIRTVRASRVNMRQGPNTTYPILGRLLAGDEVEILRDQGAGWAMVKVEKTGQIGWIATSLLSLKGS